MGRYLNPEGCTAIDKTTPLIAAGAERVTCPPKFEDVPEGKTLVCVGDRGFFAFAAVIYDQREFNEFTANIGCPKLWYLIDNETLAKLEGK